MPGLRGRLLRPRPLCELPAMSAGDLQAAAGIPNPSDGQSQMGPHRDAPPYGAQALAKSEGCFLERSHGQSLPQSAHQCETAHHVGTVVRVAVSGISGCLSGQRNAGPRKGLTRGKAERRLGPRSGVTKKDAAAQSRSGQPRQVSWASGPAVATVGLWQVV